MNKRTFKSLGSKIALVVVSLSLVGFGLRFVPTVYALDDSVGGVEAENLCTPDQICDTTPPTVSISSPANNATISGCALSLSANASDNVAVANVQFQLDGVNLGAALTSSPYNYTWNTESTSNGSHTLTAIATDTSNNQTTSSPVTVTLSNGAAVSGDINCDGVVNIFDLAIMLGSYGHTTSACINLPSYTCDISGPNGTPDGVVNSYDLQVVLTNFGK